LIIDSDYYLNVWKGKNTTDDLDKIISRAEDFVLNNIPFKNGGLVIKEELKKAISAQTEYFVEVGLETIYGIGQGIKSASIGDLNYTKEDSSGEIVNGLPILVHNYLRRGNYLYCGVDWR
jgi:hypothetical protein